MNFSCKEASCKYSSSNKEDFIEHVKKNHGIKIDQYFKLHLNKCDLLTNEAIQYKSFEQYLLTDFVNKKNLLTWLKKEKGGASPGYLLNKIQDHFSIKSVVYFPSSSEIRTVSYLPSIKTYEFFFKDLNSFIDSTSLIRRYNYNINELNLNNISKENIIVDTREQKPISFKGREILVEKLDFGDYSINKLVCVERKSLNDLVSTLSSGYERFNNEIKRCKDAGGYLVVVCDSDINKFLSFNYSRVGKFAKASPEFIFHRFRDICRNFPDTLQFCFSGGRSASSKLIPIILSLSIDEVSKIDFQYIIEKKII